MIVHPNALDKRSSPIVISSKSCSQQKHRYSFLLPLLGQFIIELGKNLIANLKKRYVNFSPCSHVLMASQNIPTSLWDLAIYLYLDSYRGRSRNAY
ncbi:hypothetical protein F8M41_001057 [Gigaspora margarita]|uniref:Uncharacterized protein n=1 Tax=Gigaspora margarita TaxID=4874 RepID=A0A8H4A9J3_GIGMA|nr:hypothetical protein F8M41_001057 [Gigaspora margarita]